MTIKGGHVRHRLLVAVCSTAGLCWPATARAQAPSTGAQLVTRSQLLAAAARAEQAATSDDASARERASLQAAAIRERLRDGDFQVGDRLVVTIVSDATHRDTVLVRTGRILALPGRVFVPLTGVLRSEVQEHVAAEVLKYVKAQEIEVTPLVRVGVLGEVARPGYFALASDLPLSDAIMTAGGPTATADLGRSVVRRAGYDLRTSSEIRQAIADGLTLDQFGLVPGDEIVIGRQKNVDVMPFVAVAGAIASLVTVYIAVHH